MSKTLRKEKARRARAEGRGVRAPPVGPGEQVKSVFYPKRSKGMRSTGV